jgi:hypothetical protein
MQNETAQIAAADYDSFSHSVWIFPLSPRKLDVDVEEPESPQSRISLFLQQEIHTLEMVGFWPRYFRAISYV